MNPELQFLNFESTNICNAKCYDYCPHSYMTRKQGIMSDEIFEKIVREVREIDTIGWVAPQLLGEPTLDNKLYNRLLYIKEKLPKKKINLITNGSYLTKEMVGVVDHVDISFNYATKKEYEEGMGLDFEGTIKKIHSLSEFKDKVTIHYVFSKNTIGHFKMLKNMFKGFNVSINPWFGTTGGLVPDLNVRQFTKRVPCSMVHFQLSIYWNGDVVPCCNDFNGSLSHLIGNVKDKTLLELFNSDYLNYLRGLTNYNGTLCEKCNYNVDQADQSDL